MLLQQLISTIKFLYNGMREGYWLFNINTTRETAWGLKGVARFYKSKKKHVITTQTEHKCVLDSCRQLEAEGFEVRG